MYRINKLNQGGYIRTYRTPYEIKRDIAEIKERISDIGDMLNIRSILIDILADERSDSPEILIPELEAAVNEAKGALKELEELDSELSALREELSEARWRLGR